MYITLFDNAIELLLDLGSRGFMFDVWLFGFCPFSIDTAYFDFAVVVLIVAIIYRRTKK